METFKTDIENLEDAKCPYIKVNLRGTVYKTERSKFKYYPKSRLATLSQSSSEYDEQNNEYFFDRNSDMFPYILDVYTTGELHIPKFVCAGHIRNELKFWGIEENLLKDCCWHTVYCDDSLCDSYQELASIDNNEGKSYVVPWQGKIHGVLTHEQCFRKKLWQMLRNPRSSIHGKMWFAIILLCVLSSIIVFGLTTLEEMRVPRHPDYIHPFNLTNHKLDLFNEMEAKPVLRWIDFGTNVIIFVDLILRFYSCPNKKQFTLNLFNLIDLCITLMIFYLTYTDFKPIMTQYEQVYEKWLVLRYVYALRALRLLRLFHHTRGMKVLQLCLRANITELLFFVMIFLSLSCIFGSLIYHTELDEIGKFQDFFVSVWWAVITMSSVGYGDQVPSTSPGYVVGTVTSICGVLLVAIPIVVIASNFGHYYDCFKIRDAHIRKTKNNST